MLVLVTRNGEVIFRNVAGEEMARVDSGKRDLVDMAVPFNDDNFICLLSKNGDLSVMNYTVIDSPNAYSRYLRE